MLAERGCKVSYEAIRGWVHLLASLLAAELRKRRRGKCPIKWPVDEISIRINGKWWYLWRAIDGDGNLIDARLSDHRDSATCEVFLNQAKRNTIDPLAPIEIVHVLIQIINSSVSVVLL